MDNPPGGRVGRVVSMVRGNKPWRLALGMRSAIAAVLATSAYLVITSTIWSLASYLSLTKLGITMLAAIVLMVVWILNAHHLWENADDYEYAQEAVLENISTIITLFLGVLTMAAGVFVFNVLVTLFFLQPPLFTGALADHLRLAWLATGFATVAGALGSGLDSDGAVRRAAYGESGSQHSDANEEEDDDASGPSADHRDRSPRAVSRARRQERSARS